MKSSSSRHDVAHNLGVPLDYEFLEYTQGTTGDLRH